MAETNGGCCTTLRKVVDFVLLLPFFLILAVAIPLIDAQTCLPYHPPALLDLKNWYQEKCGDYLMSEKPSFFVGLVWLEIVFLWPLCLANSYAILAGKPWFQTTCLMSGASTITSMVAIMAELMGSGKASDKMIQAYVPFVFFAAVATLRGIFPCSAACKNTSSTAAAVTAAKTNGTRKKRS